MIVKIIPSTWLIEEEHRLDCGPFVKGGIEARKTIEGLRYQKDQLVDLTKNGINGIYHVGQDKIIWAEDEIHGMPFLRSTDILKADLSYQPFISRKQVAGNYLFQCPAGSTLITRSGTIGRIAYMRPDMEDMAISQDVLKVMPDVKKVRPGYLYAFLSSKYGIPIITGGTFGSIIVHIEAENIADLPVPRLGSVEEKAHELVEKASILRVEANIMINDAKAAFAYLTEDLEYKKDGPKVNTVYASELQERMDANFHDATAHSIRALISQGQHGSVESLCEKVFLPGIFKRIYIEDVAFGAEYHSASSIFSISPAAKEILSRKSSLYNDVLLSVGTILIQAFGQEDGLIGRVAWVGKHLDKAATTHMFVRLVTKESELAGYMFAYLSSDPGYRLLSKLPYGGSIPHFSAKQVEKLPVPLLDEEVMTSIGRNVLQAQKNRDDAIDLEMEARALVERTIQEGGR